MNNKIEPGSPAFPQVAGSSSVGLTKREWFAAHALVGLLASNRADYAEDVITRYAELANQQADALIVVLNQASTNTR